MDWFTMGNSKLQFMKTIFALIATILMSLNGFSNHFSSVFNLKLHDNSPFMVVLDNQPFEPTQMFTLPDLEPGYHMLKVARIHPVHPGYGYGHGHSKKVIFKGWINIPPKSVIYSRIDCHSHYDVIKVEPYFCPPAGGGCSTGWGYDDDDEWGYSSAGYNGWGPAPYEPMHPCMGHHEFDLYKSSIASRDFDNSKLQVASQGLSNNYLSSAQIAEVMKMFTFESSRLEYAKKAYSRVTDKQNFYLVNNSFTFDSSIKDLQAHIGGK